MGLLDYLKKIFSWFRRNPKKSIAGISAALLVIAIRMNEEVDKQVIELKETAAEIKKTKEIPKELPTEIKVKSSTTWKEVFTKISTEAQSRIKIQKRIKAIIEDETDSDTEYVLGRGKGRISSNAEYWIKDIDRQINVVKTLMKADPDVLKPLIASLGENKEDDLSSYAARSRRMISSELGLSIDEEGILSRLLFQLRRKDMGQDYDSKENPSLYLKDLTVELCSRMVKEYQDRAYALLEKIRRVQELIALAEKEGISSEDLPELYNLESGLLELKSVDENYAQAYREALQNLKQIR